MSWYENRGRRLSLPRRVGRWVGDVASWSWAHAACWLAGCRDAEVVALAPEVFGAGASGGVWHGVEARCPRCGRVEYRDSTLVFPEKKDARHPYP